MSGKHSTNVIEETSSDDSEWRTVNKKRKRTNSNELKQNRTMENTGNGQNFPKFKAMANAEQGVKTSYAAMVKLEKEWPALSSKVRARPNIYGQWVITPKDQEAYNYLKANQVVPLQQLRPEDKYTKCILLKYPVEMDLCHITSKDTVVKASRCMSKDKTPTRQVEVYILGSRPEYLDLGLWGRYQLRPFNEEPLRCFRCQKFGHHRATCHSEEICGICSGRHPTKQ